jgi:hypothetical protein
VERPQQPSSLVPRNIVPSSASTQKATPSTKEGVGLDKSNSLSPVHIVFITISCNILVIFIFYAIYKLLKKKQKCCFKNKIIDKKHENATLQERLEQQGHIETPTTPITPIKHVLGQKTSTNINHSGPKRPYVQKRSQLKRKVHNTIQKNKTIGMLNKQIKKTNKPPSSAGLLMLQEEIKQPPLPSGEPPMASGDTKQSPDNTKQLLPSELTSKKDTTKDQHIVDIKNK